MFPMPKTQAIVGISTLLQVVSGTYPQFTCCCLKIPLASADLVLQKSAEVMSEKQFGVSQLKEKNMIGDVQPQISGNKRKLLCMLSDFFSHVSNMFGFKTLVQRLCIRFTLKKNLLISEQPHL